MEIECTLCGSGSRSVARIYLPLGCMAYEGERVQELCAQHLLSVEPIEPFEPLVIRDRAMYDRVT